MANFRSLRPDFTTLGAFRPLASPSDAFIIDGMSYTKWLDRALTLVLVVCAVIVTLAVARREFAAPRTNAAAVTEVKAWQDYVVGQKVTGPSQAKVTIVEFSDFQCPFCAEFSKTLDAAREKYPDQIRVVFRHFPIQRIHPFARQAAMASECAAIAGRFGAYKQFLFAHQDTIGKMTWPAMAHSAGISDTATFSQCLASESVNDEIIRDSLAAKSLRVSGTPTILVNRWLISGAPTAESLDSLIRKELGAGRR